MYTKTASLLLTVIAGATINPPEVADAVKDLINTLDDELNQVGFDPGSDLEEAELALEAALNEADEDREDLEEAAAIALASVDEEDSEDDDGSDEV